MNLLLSSSKTLLAMLFVGVGAYACSSSTTPGSGAGGADSGSGSGGATETFSDVYTTVLQPNCTSHHGAGLADGFLDLSTRAAAISSLVGVAASGPACGSTSAVRVVAGKPSQSLLYEKVSQASPPCGAQMPLNGTPLSAAEQAKIQTWISEGAQDN